MLTQASSTEGAHEANTGPACLMGAKTCACTWAPGTCACTWAPGTRPAHLALALAALLHGSITQARLGAANGVRVRTQLPAGTGHKCTLPTEPTSSLACQLTVLATACAKEQWQSEHRRQVHRPLWLVSCH